MLCKWLPIGDGFWVKDRGVCPVPLSALGPPTWLCRPCACHHSLRGFMCVSACCVGVFINSVSLVSSIPSGSCNISVSYSASFPELRGKASGERIHLRLSELGGKASDESHLRPSVQKISHSVHIAQL